MLFYFDESDLIRLRPARQYLESLLPELTPPVLDVGVKKYTEHFRSLIQPPYVTVDRVERRNPTIVADVLEPTFLEVAGKLRYGSVLFNGMIGFGVDTPESILVAFRAFHCLLETKGTLLVGWNEEFISREELAVLLRQAGFLEERDLVEPGKNPERHCFWWWRRDI